MSEARLERELPAPLPHGPHLLLTLSRQMQVQVAKVVSRELVASVDVFSQTSDEFIEAASTSLHTMEFTAGEFLYHAEDTCSTLYIISSGTVEMVKTETGSNSYIVEDTFAVGEAVGFMEYLYGAC